MKKSHKQKGVLTIVFTENEISKMIDKPFRYSMVENDEKLLKLLNRFLYTIGVDTDCKIEIEHGLIARNRFNEIDNSCRIVCRERSDDLWVKSKYASHEAKSFIHPKRLGDTLKRLMS